jgi:hypothetical protein
MKKLLWTIALIAALSFVFIACGPDDEEPSPLSAVYIDVPTGGAWTGVPLTTTTSGGTDVTYSWTARGSSTSLGTDSSFSPSNPGWYTVTATDGDGVEVRTDNVFVGPIDLKGTWLRTAAKNTGWGVSTLETLTLTVDGYLIVETPGDDGYKYAISNWESVTRNSINLSTGSGFGTYIGTNFNTIAYKVTGTFSERGTGYTSDPFGGSGTQSETAFYIIMKNDKSEFFRTYPLNIETGSTIRAHERIFEKSAE